VSRGGNRWNIFLDDYDRTRFLWLLGTMCRQHNIEVHAYCLMGNHFHLVLYCPEPVLSAAMRDLKSRYARYFNERHNGSGPVFEAPFVEVPVLSDEHLQTEIRYVARNPLDLDPNICLASYRWSSHGIYLGLRPRPTWMQTRIGHELFGPSYRSDVETPRASDKIQNNVQPIVTSPGDATIGVAEDWSLAGIRREVAHAAEEDVAEVRTRSHNGLLGVAALLATAQGFTAAEIADPYGFGSPSAVRMAIKRTRKRLCTDADLGSTYELAAGRLRQAA